MISYLHLLFFSLLNIDCGGYNQDILVFVFRAFTVKTIYPMLSIILVCRKLYLNFYLKDRKKFLF